jgi:saccharopine dehydrogenase (NADP+, L-glutamate forming)/spermidine synthase
MKQILVLGAGLVSRPLLRYLLRFPEYRLLVATDDPAHAERQMGDHPRGRATELDVRDENALRPLVEEADLVVSLLPANLNPRVARHCVGMRRPMVNSSYVSDGLRKLDRDATEAGVLVLCEAGLDPGIDHMSAVATIRRLRHGGGRIARFFSACGGVPAQDANTNPWGYKFSWSPMSVLLAALQPARYLPEGQEVEVAAGEAPAHAWPMAVDDGGVYEVFANRDSIPYRDAYGAGETESFMRATLRYRGWCNAMDAAQRIGYLDRQEADWPEGATYRQFVARQMGVANGEGLIVRVAEFLGVDPDDDRLACLEWTGLLSERPIGLRRASPLEVFARRLSMMMAYEPGERDRVVLEHVFDVDYPDGSREQVRSRLTRTGDPWGDSAMASTVSLTAAIAARLILGRGVQAVGVQIPTLREIYEPVLDELAERGIALTETHIENVRGPFQG